MPDVDRASSLVQKTMDNFDTPGVSVAALTRQCQRIASLRGDGVALAWMNLESTDIYNEVEGTSGDLTMHDSLAARLLKTDPSDGTAAERWRTEYHRYLSRRRLQPDSNQSQLRSVQQLEESIQMLRDQEAATLVPPPAGMATHALTQLVTAQQNFRIQSAAARAPLNLILARIKERLWEFLNETEYELTFGEATAETFDRLRAYVDKQLTTISPPALEQFQTAYRRIKDGSDEDRAHALTSCRRVLKTLADQLYPASPDPVLCSDGKTRVLTDPMFVNRLLQYVGDTVGKHENGAVVQATLKDVDARLAALNSLASKGVHANVTTYEVDTCVVQTYLVVADVLRIRERASDAAATSSPTP